MLQQNLKSSAVIKRLLVNHVKPYKSEIFIAIFFMVVVATCSAAVVWLTKPAIDKILVARNMRMLVIIPLLMLGVYVIKGIAEYYQGYLIKYVGQKILTDMQIQMYEHLLYADLAYVQSQSSGRLISRFTNDIILMRGAVSNMLIGCAKYFLSVVFLIIIMFNLEPFLSMFVFLAFPIAIYPVQKLGRKMRRVTGDAQEELSNYTARLDETFQSIKIIKSFCAEKIESVRAKEITTKILSFYKKSAMLDSLTSPVMEFLCGLAIAFVLWYGGFQVISGDMTIGELFTFIAAFVSAYRPFKSLVSLNVNLQEGLAAANRIFNILDTKPLIQDNANALKPDFGCPEIFFEKITLNFEEKEAIKLVNLKIEKAKTYAIVGKSGSGKTSLANLLVRFYDPTEGRVLINSNDIKDISVTHLRNQIAMVSQDTILVDASIAENIAYGNLAATRQEIIDAAKHADADEFISKLVDGYDTVIGIGGCTLSGGQKQRLAIARAFLKNSPIMLFDEATSALDPESEQSIVHSFTNLRKGKTTLIITHRLASIRDVDKIIVMKNGEIEEQGTHEELINLKSEYYKLHNKQLKEKAKTV
ncbi:MAG: ABC transporter ATP-binding protein [Alphaproteobacteria bacterium]|jgi:subfamily B ATP-binding cassette protein MsbA|nr:ABC transporter ATP-binding protein/permease [Rickettsiales bacterium]MCE2731187.1 ABC transporter ATP-binding protein/permease [Rickettsiaceae bacterium]NBU52799.1 ABC transporter ATP-binding protein [Alphaproteobacteria bacterium]UCM93996.1 MAG: ABC transporter ATP-binding protein/permease [Candidatus Megaira endosymbiont of Mesostigma viride]NBY35341.1 ABC transporter ATP-binding protein [Alphaproteobacteria bacterium]